MLHVINNVLYNSVVFNYKGTYEEGMEKLVLAEDISNIDDISSDGLKKQAKKKRHVKAKKYMSFSSDEDVFYHEDGSNHVKQTPAKLLSVCPEIGNFVSPKSLHTHTSVQDHQVQEQYQNRTSCTMSGNGE